MNDTAGIVSRVWSFCHTLRDDGRWRRFTYEEITGRGKTSLDIFWIMESINGR